MNCCAAVGRERDAGHRAIRGAAPVDERLRDVLPGGREHLQAAILPVGHVDELVVRDLHGVHGPAELLRARDRRCRTAAAPRPALAGCASTGALPKAPHIRLNAAGVGVEHDDATVAVAVGDVQLVGLRMHEHVGRLVDALAVGVPAALVGPANLQQELPVLGELQQHVVGALGQRRRRRTAAADPDVVLVVHEDAVLAVGPVEPRPGSAPGAQECAVGIELEQRWRRLRALPLGHRARTVQHPDVVVAVDGHARRLPQHPVVRQLRARTDPLRRRGPASRSGTPAPARHGSRASRPPLPSRCRQRCRRDSATLIEVHVLGPWCTT